VLIETDVDGSRAGVAGVTDLTSKAFGRLGHFLAYDGAAATRDAPRPRSNGDACALVSSQEAEAILGPLAGAPTPSGRGSETTCTYRVRVEGGAPAEIHLAITWRDGFLAFGQQKEALGVFRSSQEEPIIREVAGSEKEMASDSEAQKFMGALRQFAGKVGVETEPGTVRLKTDTLVPGPWAEGAIMAG
jgi:hypothetical protein